MLIRRSYVRSDVTLRDGVDERDVRSEKRVSSNVFRQEMLLGAVGKKKPHGSAACDHEL